MISMKLSMTSQIKIVMNSSIRKLEDKSTILKNKEKYYKKKLDINKKNYYINL